MLRNGFQNEMNFHLRAVGQLGIRRSVFDMEGERCVFAKFRVLTAVRFYHIEFNNRLCWRILEEQHLTIDICDFISDLDTLLESIYV